MSAPANSSTSKGYRVYTWQGTEYPSVTSVLRVINKPMLVPWAAKMVAERAVSVAPQLARMVEEDPEDTLRFLKNAHYRRSNSAANLGTMIHEALEAWADGSEAPLVTDEMKPYLRGARMFFDDYQPEFVHSEATFYSDTYNYAGTADFIARIHGEVVLGDYKTGKGVYPEVALQLAAYAHADFIVADDKAISIPAIEAGAAVHIQKDSYRYIPVRIDQKVYDAFLAARDLFAWEQEISAHVLKEDA